MAMRLTIEDGSKALIKVEMALVRAKSSGSSCLDLLPVAILQMVLLVAFKKIP